MPKLTALTLFIFCIVAFASCSNTLNNKYSEANYNQDLKALIETKQADTTDAVYMTIYVMQAKLTGEKLTSQTYAQLLQKAKELSRKDGDKADVRAFAKEETELSLRKQQLVSVTLCGKGFKKGDFQDYLVYDILFVNKCNKDIHGLKGSLKLTDIRGAALQDLDLKEDGLIPAGKMVKKSYLIDFKDFKEGDVLTSNTDIKNVKTEWQPGTIRFTDGSVIE